MWPFGKDAKARLEEELKENPVLSTLDLKVKVKKSKAIFSGEVTVKEQLKLLEMVAESINGIDDVDLSDVKVDESKVSEHRKKIEAEVAKRPKLAPLLAPALEVPHTASKAAPKLAPALSTKENDGDDKVDAIRINPFSRAQQALKAIKKKKLDKNPIELVQRDDEVILRGAVESQEELDAIVAEVEKVAPVNKELLKVVKNAKALNTTDDDGDIVYTVKSGDTLSHIALHYYGDAGKKWYMKIAEANGVDNPDYIQVGQELKIPGTPDSPTNFV